ncbi:thiamine-phosphate kinase [Candidatus Nitrospira bockiana]
MRAASRGRPSSPLREFSLIDDILRRFGKTGSRVVRGIGDDAALIRAAPSRDLILTTDLLAEGIHFDRRTATWEDIGYKAAVANLSDVAAMGGRPEHVLVSLAVPPHSRPNDILELYRGIMDACAPHHVDLIGGDTSASRHGVFVSLTLTGSVPHGAGLRRDGARVGDGIYVTGTLGDSAAGLDLLARRRGHGRLAARARGFLIGRHRRPTPRLDVGQWLTTHRLASAAIDISDGLSGDLRHVCEQSRVGAQVDAERLPLSQPLRRYAEATGVDAVDLALRGGEDYELLFTVPPRSRPKLERLAADLPRPIHRIGEITAGRGEVALKTSTGRIVPLPATSWEHFRRASRNGHKAPWSR